MRRLAQEQGPPGATPQDPVTVRTAEAFEGYTLFTPLMGTTTYLIDMEGQVVHRWDSEFLPGASEYLLPNGHLLRCVRDPDVSGFHAGGRGGRLIEFDWDGNLVWEYRRIEDGLVQHHDIEPLPDGNVLMICWQRHSLDEAVARGADPRFLPDGEIWSETILEVEPVRPEGGRVVWEWHVWDHLIQDRDPEAPNHGPIDLHPERIDVNAGRQFTLDTGEPDTTPRGGPPADWLHINSIDHDPEFDQIVLSVLNLNEIWIVDHSTTTDEARGSTGGRGGRGGDLLYRWGNPAMHDRDTARPQQLFGQHDAHWIPGGRPGAGNLLVFNNGHCRDGSEGGTSTVLQLSLPRDGDGAEAIGRNRATSVVWQYQDPPRFYSHFVSGSQRLPNGNTLICSGARGRIFEVTPDGEVCWDFHNPFQPAAGPGRDAPGLQRGRPPGERASPSPRNPALGIENAMFRARRIAPDDPALAGRSGFDVPRH